jgi:hypothetical protein
MFFFRPETDSESEDDVVAGPLGQLRGVEDSSDSDSDLMPQQPRYRTRYTGTGIISYLYRFRM